MRVDASGLLDNVHRSLIEPAHENVEVPIVEKKKAQVLSVQGNRAQLMDLENYENFDLDIPAERRGDMEQGSEVDYYTVLDVKTLKQLK